jgi:excisionase family DNA binding protein
MKKITLTAPVEQPRLLDVKMAAHYLTTSVWGIRELIYSKAIPHIRLGKKILIDRVDLDKFVEKQKAAA